MVRIAVFSALVICLTTLHAAESPPSGNLDAAKVEFFEKKIRPVLVEHCYECHAADSESIQGGLRVDDGPAFRAGGDSGPAFAPGHPEASVLISAIEYQDFEMPPAGKLDEQVIQNFRTWIAEGAVDPRMPQDPASSAEVTERTVNFKTNFWAFQNPQPQARPSVAASAWPSNFIDYFVLAQMERHGLAPAPPIDDVGFLRRLSFDLTGLPPAEEDVRRVIESGTLDRTEMTERLLASVRFGERWARLWMDVARYAEDQAHIVGDDKSLFFPNAYLYRDWLIDAFNRDVPYDQFIRLQLAADLLPDAEDHLVALGFIGVGPKYYNRGRLDVKADEWEDRVDTVTRGLMGLTVACAMSRP
ncbi:MAG: DUF1549 domain-containing protein [Pirellulaceae bacterium]